jgi:hypothetical protein
VKALSDYLANKHGMSVSWLDDNRAHVKGKYTVVAIDAEVIVEGAKVRVSGKDPGMLWRGPAKKYIASKLARYLDPAESLAALPRS